MTWHEIVVDCPRGLVERVGAVLFELGTAGVQEDYEPGTAPPPRQPWDTGAPPPEPARKLVRGWFEDPDRDRVAARLVRLLGASATQVSVRWDDVPEVDWDEQWKQSFQPLRVSPRIVIAPPWDAPEGAVVIEPGQGFGTGQHTSTQQALRAIDELAGEVRTVLDVGSGSGVLAIAAAKLGLEAEGIDVDPVAVKDAAQNADRNEVDVAFSTTPLAAVPGPADLVVANLFAEVLAAEAIDLVRVTGRWLVLAGVLADRENVVRTAFDDRLTLAWREVDGEWVSLRYRRDAAPGRGDDQGPAVGSS